MISLLLMAPAALALFIILHQEVLQRNFILSYKISSHNTQTHAPSWLDELMKGCLSALNKNKELIGVIERDTKLDSIIIAPFKMSADLQKEIFEILIEKHEISNNNMIWISHDGKFRAINATFDINIDSQWLTKELAQISKWKQNSIYITKKTDAIVFKINPISRTFDLIMNGNIMESLTPSQAHNILLNYFNSSKELQTIPSTLLKSNMSEGSQTLKLDQKF